MMPIEYTVALCTHNQAKRLKKTLADFTKINVPDFPWELLIVDNGCKDSTPQLLNNFKWPNNWQVSIVKESKLGLSNARNRAIVEAKGKYIIFIDDDETVDPDWLCAYERLIKDKQPDAFGGRICVSIEDNRPLWLKDELFGFLGEINRMNMIALLNSNETSFFGGNFGIRKEVFTTVGNFNSMLGRKGSNNTGGEETDLYHRLLQANFKVWWTPEAIIYHRIEASKLKRTYFLDLHYRQGRIDGTRKREHNSRLPPWYLYGQIYRAILTVVKQFFNEGSNETVRKEMNVAYLFGYITGWAFAPKYEENLYD